MNVDPRKKILEVKENSEKNYNRIRKSEYLLHFFANLLITFGRHYYAIFFTYLIWIILFFLNFTISQSTESLIE